MVFNKNLGFFYRYMAFFFGGNTMKDIAWGILVKRELGPLHSITSSGWHAPGRGIPSKFRDIDERRRKCDGVSQKVECSHADTVAV